LGIVFRISSNLSSASFSSLIVTIPSAMISNKPVSIDHDLFLKPSESVVFYWQAEFLSFISRQSPRMSFSMMSVISFGNPTAYLIQRLFCRVRSHASLPCRGHETAPLCRQALYRGQRLSFLQYQAPRSDLYAVPNVILRNTCVSQDFNV